MVPFDTPDYFAIRCRQYELTVALVGGSSGLPCPPIILPNLNFSFALAKFYLESAATTPPASDSPSASACLVAALASYPYFLRPILTACKISDLTVGIGSTPSSAEGPSVGHCVWSTVLSHPHFALECPEVTCHLRI